LAQWRQPRGSQTSRHRDYAPRRFTSYSIAVTAAKSGRFFWFTKARKREKHAPERHEKAKSTVLARASQIGGKATILVVRFTPAVTLSAALILAGPVIGQLRAAVQDAFPGQYRTILVSVVGVFVAVAVVAAFLRIRDRKALRFGAIVAALAIGVTYSVLSRTGDPAVDAVERLHFVEYGLVTLLFYRAWRPVGDVSLFILTVLAGVLIGTLEEWLQWFVPARVGEARDIFLNLWAILCGLLFSVAIEPPERMAFSLRSESRTHVRRVAAGVVLAFALFFHFAHLGYEIHDADAGPFRSAYTREDLAELARDRAERWRTAPPLSWSRYSREDQYFSEGVALVRLRNRCWDAGDAACAWRKNVILERYYAPVVDSPSYVSAAGHRWPQEQREDASRRISGGPKGVAENVEDSIIYTWPKPVFWTMIAAVIALLLFV
jgi:hypothetical protein